MARRAHGGMLREITNIDQGKEADDQDRADDQDTQHRSAEKTPSRFDSRLNDMSIFFIHETASYDLSIYHAGVKNFFLNTIPVYGKLGFICQDTNAGRLLEFHLRLAIVAWSAQASAAAMPQRRE